MNGHLGGGVIFKVGATFTAYFHKGQVLGDNSVNANFCGKFDGFFALFELFVKDNSVYRLIDLYTSQVTEPYGFF